MADPFYPNRVLTSLTAAELGLLQPHLKIEPLDQGVVLYESGETMTRVFFPHSGVISLVVTLDSGEMVEIGMVGRDGLIGGAAIWEANESLNQSIVQIAGAASVVEVEYFKKITRDNDALRALVFRHEQAILVQAQQSAACNAGHTLEARLSRWLLRCRDLMNSDDLRLTQEFLGQMLGVQRSSVSITASALQDAGLIRYRRGHIRILDVERLRNMSCECYLAVRTQAERLFSEIPV